MCLNNHLEHHLPDSQRSQEVVPIHNHVDHHVDCAAKGSVSPASKLEN